MGGGLLVQGINEFLFSDTGAILWKTTVYGNYAPNGGGIGVGSTGSL